MRADLGHLERVAGAFRTAGVPALARLADQPPRVFVAQTRIGTLDLETSLDQLRPIQANANKVVGNLERRRGQFDAAASLPGAGLTLNQGAWLGLAAGAALLLLGIVGMLRPRRWPAAVVLAAGTGLIVAGLVLDYPRKTADTDAIVDSLRPFSAEKVQGRREGLATTRGVFAGLQDEVVAAVASRANTTVPAVRKQLAAASPALTPDSLAEASAAIDRFDELVRFSARAQPLLVEVDGGLSARAVAWLLLLGPGLALALAGAIGLLVTRREERV